MKESELPECKRCGVCCQVYDLQFEKKDLERWCVGNGSILEDQSETGSRSAVQRVEDLDTWLDETFSVPVPSNFGTYEIFSFISFVSADLLCGDLWFHPETREELGRCPFLRKVPQTKTYRCMIFEIRPEICRQDPGHCPEPWWNNRT